MSEPPPDTIAVRVHDAIDVDVLYRWLSSVHPELFGVDEPLAISQFPAGFSNLTFLLRIGTGATAREYVLRRPPRGVKGGSAHDMGREFTLLSALHPAGVPVPRPVAFCDDMLVIGAPFYVMERVDGIILRGKRAEGVTLDSPTLSRLSHTFIATMAQLHAVDVVATGLATLGKPEGYVQRQVQGWNKRWLASRTDDVPAMDQVAAWLDVNRPPERGATLVHNDFKFDNIVLARDDLSRVVAILDWEMATVGDPLMDLGTSLAYWVEADDPPVFRSLGLGITALPGNATRAELVEMYANVTGRDVSNAAFYHAFGLFKVAVIAQQIYARHVQGLTSDPRFGALNVAVAAMAESAAQVIARGRV